MYELQEPAPELAPFISQYWFVRATDDAPATLTVDVYVDGQADLVLNFGVGYDRWTADALSTVDRSNVDAQRTVPVQIRQTGAVDVCGVRFEPGGLSLFSEYSMHRFTDRIVPLAEILRGPVARHEDAIRRRTGPDRAGAIDAMLLDALSITAVQREQHLLLQTLSATPPATVRELSGRFGVTARTVERLFRRMVGVTPKFYLRIARFQKALRMLMDNGTIDLAALALECGYYDQPHLVREFHALAGGIPRSYKGYMPEQWRDFAPNVIRYGDPDGAGNQEQ